MCVLAFQYDDHEEYTLIFAGNRDEFYARPTAPADFWEDASHVLAGRDLRAGGTWLGVTRRGHWGVVTNVRDEHPYRPEARSRGALVANYLRAEPEPKAYLEQVAADAEHYNGFNLLVGTPTSLYYLTNREDSTVERVEPGLHGLSNKRLDTPWPKVQRTKTGLHRHLQADDLAPESLFSLLEDRRRASDEALPDTGVGMERERMLSPIFVDGEKYGTRSSTVLLIDRDGTVTFVERRFTNGAAEDTRRFTFEVPTRSIE